jgi:gliding motility-associated-like protein
MLNRFRYILLFCIALFSSFNAAAQLAMPDNVCIVAVKHYNVDPNPVPGSTYIWKIDGVIQSGFTTNEIDITWNTAGTYLLEVQELSVDGCLGPVRSGQVFVSPIPILVVTSNSPICQGSSINLTAETIQGGTFLWTGTNEYSSTDQNPVILSASTADAGTYSLIVSANGCTSAPSTIIISVNNCNDFDFFIPEGFSPNGDGINDLFVIRGIEYYPGNKIVIFNRWGDKIFEASPYQNTWDGKTTMGLRVGGDELPIGTYFYLLDLGNGSDIIKGTIYLNR